MRPTLRKLAATSTLLLVAGLGSACGSSDTSDGSSAGGQDVTLRVFAAASLKSTFEQLGQQFEAEHEGVTVEFNFAGSSDLVAQIQEGAPADVFASADTANMDKAVGDDLVEGDPVDFATNTLEIAVPPDNPAGVATLQDLTESGLNLVVCAPEVPCGAATVTVEEAAGLTFSPVSEEQSVTDVLNKVTTGEADAGLVYVTDVIAAGDSVTGIEFPESSEAVNTYPAAALSDSENADLAAAFVDLVAGDDGQKVLADAGFAPPPS